MKPINVIDHPVLKHKLGCLRNEKTGSVEFRHIVREISWYLAFEATRDLDITAMEINSPMGPASVEKIKDAPVIVAVMRAGNAMLDAIHSVIPSAGAGHIGIYRDKFLNNTVEYYFKIPEDVENKIILVADPLIATGHTAVACVDRLKGYGARDIRFLSIISSKAGVERLIKRHPGIKIFTLAIESTLNDDGYLIPGLGDVGNRLYNSK